MTIQIPYLPKKIKARKGFALVLSLALMGFMVLLIVTLATMVQMQLRLSRQAMIDFKAKQAAKFAAYQAMSRIQTTLGPDTRITANAMMFDNTLFDGIALLEQDENFDWWTSPMDISREEVEEVDGVGISQNRYWVGVWDSRRGYHPSLMKIDENRDDYVRNTIEKSITWLVSGNTVRSTNKDSSSSPKYLPTQKLEDGTYVRLVSGGSSAGSNGERRADLDVLAPLVKLSVDANAVSGEKITDGKETRIAWWVSDENQKASLNAVAQQNILEHAQTIDYRVQSLPFYSGIHGLTMPGQSGTAGDLSFNFDFSSGGDTSSISRIRNLSDISQLDIYRSKNIPDTIQFSKIFFHSASFDTKGLLVNVRDGGMKKDLSLGLTRKDFGNEKEILEDDDDANAPEYFERPYGVSGYDFKTTAYPLQQKDVYKHHLNPNDTREESRKLKGSGHIFGPQMYGNELIEDAESLSSIKMVSDMFRGQSLWKDPGGPLWDQLRSYYNLRTSNLASEAILNERVQTDDRFGLKPIVKRFQVFYVPTFVNYGGNKYGLRLHIMPLLILYNPFDTKIKGDTYYAIRVWGHARHPVGAFRFAIGYNVGDYFQCLRDLRTETIPSLADRVVGQNPSQKELQQFTVPFRFGMNYSTTKLNQANDNSIYDESKIIPTYYTMSRFTRFYNGFKFNGRFVPAYPLGYGTKIDGFSSNDVASTIAPSDIEVIEDSGADGMDNKAVGEFRHWRGIVSSSNIVPTLDKAKSVQGNGFYARVARIPLFLNNIVYSVSHGTYTGTTGSSSEGDYMLFLSQRSIDSRNPHNAKQTDGRDDANLMFMAYDAKGIEPGKAKIFSMTGIVNYVGNPQNDSSSSNEDGPNGVIESKKGVSPYESKKAMLRGLDDNGVLGGCFYVDIPHPEAEHSAKYDNDRDWRYNNSSSKYVMFDLDEINNNEIYAFDGSRCNVNINDLCIDMADLQNGYPRNETINEGRRQFGATFNMTPIGYGISTYNGDYSQNRNISEVRDSTKDASYWNPTQRHAPQYIKLHLDVWIWKREGFEFGKYSNNDDSGMDYDYKTSIMGPSLVHMVGSRFFMFNEPSFPDPSQVPDDNPKGPEDYNKAKVLVNYHTPGKAFMRNNGSRLLSLAAMRNTRYSSPYVDANNYTSLNKISDRWTVDTYLNKNFGFKIDTSRNYSNTEEQMIRDYDANKTEDDINQLGRARFYLNWLSINPRRHSANYWKNYDNTNINQSSFIDNFKPSLSDVPNSLSGNASKKMAEASDDNYNGLGDILPYAIKHQGITISQGDYNYADKLHSALNNTSGAVPYGIVFALPYPSDNQPGHEPFFNVRTFVNSNIQATGYYPDGSGRETSLGKIYNTVSRIPKHIQAINQAYGTTTGMTNVGYTVNRDGSYVRTGLKETIGTYQAPIFHILRKTEVVSNPANLASANLTFGVGKFYNGMTYIGEKDKNIRSDENVKRSYALQSFESQYPSFAIGNSLCPHRISPERPFQVTWIDGAGRYWDTNLSNSGDNETGQYDGKREKGEYYEDRNVLYDVSWLLNDALWDEYFFSTLPYRNDERENTADSEIAYPQNPRIQYAVSKDEQLRLNDLNSTTIETQFDENSSKMWVNGAFNVNSTSIDAWKAVLSTYYGIEMNDYASGTPQKLNDVASFARWAAPYDASKEFNDTTSVDMEDNVFQGFRTLNNDELEKLATAIVEHIKDRGPFYSMSHFVNRVSAVHSAEQRYTENYVGEGNIPLPEITDDRRNLEEEYNGILTHRIGHTQKGILQAAIDSTSINEKFHRDNETLISKTNDRNMSEMLKGNSSVEILRNPEKLWENWRAAVGPQATGVPSYLMQQDILSKLGSFLTVRSDTFKIRAYGEVRNPLTGAIEGRAWCEMVVQRTPEYMDKESQNQEAWRVSGREREIGHQSDFKTKGINYNEYLDELSPLNKELGRRFKIVSFRWLNEKEI